MKDSPRQVKNSNENYRLARAMVHLLAQLQQNIRQTYVADGTTKMEILEALATTEAALHRWRYSEGLSCGKIQPPVLQLHFDDIQLKPVIGDGLMTSD